MYDNSPKVTLATIGYEGANIQDFIETLRDAGIKSLIDVRELPLSRKKGFSKTALGLALEDAGISYTHVRALGDPKPGRQAARAGDMKGFRRIFGEHMKLPSTQDALDALLPTIRAGGACLLCFERCHTDCHRSIVADALSQRVDIDLSHIGVRHGIAECTHT